MGKNNIVAFGLASLLSVSSPVAANDNGTEEPSIINNTTDKVTDIVNNKKPNKCNFSVMSLQNCTDIIGGVEAMRNLECNIAANENNCADFRLNEELGLLQDHLKENFINFEREGLKSMDLAKFRNQWSELKESLISNCMEAVEGWDKICTPDTFYKILRMFFQIETILQKDDKELDYSHIYKMLSTLNKDLRKRKYAKNDYNDWVELTKEVCVENNIHPLICEYALNASENWWTVAWYIANLRKNNHLPISYRQASNSLFRYAMQNDLWILTEDVEGKSKAETIKLWDIIRHKISKRIKENNAEEYIREEDVDQYFALAELFAMFSSWRMKLLNNIVLQLNNEEEIKDAIEKYIDYYSLKWPSENSKNDFDYTFLELMYSAEVVFQLDMESIDIELGTKNNWIQ